MTITEEQLSEWGRGVATMPTGVRGAVVALIAEVRRLRAAPLSREQAMRVADAVFALAALRSRRQPLDAPAALATIVDHVLGEQSEVERAERAYLDACYAFDADPFQYALEVAQADAWAALCPAREKAGRRG